ncbi:hypothetical protein J6590_070307 [Homalodisca vitripennis]|nr:hypothetical protein J6590_070307 [Homalodisca vitripennis]
MLMLAALLLVAAQSLQPAQAWGGLFNRFSPEMLSNLGYGGHGSFRAQPFLQTVELRKLGAVGHGSQRFPPSSVEFMNSSAPLHFTFVTSAQDSLVHLEGRKRNGK